MTDAHKEAAREIVNAHAKHSVVVRAEQLIDAIASALASRDTETERLRKWQAGLAATTLSWSEQRLSDIASREVREIETHLIDLFTEEAMRLHKVPGAFTNRLAHVAAQLVASRDTEVREVLEGLRNNHGCWCPGSEEHEFREPFVCGPGCKRAQVLYEKVQVKESRDVD